MMGSFAVGNTSLSALVYVTYAVVVNTFVATQAEARAFFVFGDSLVDNGNNNYLATTARADAPPYGIDYPTHQPTGRFSNGLNIPDLISQHLGSESTLPYLSPQLTGRKLLVGANFASAGIGILNDTGVQFVNIIRMPSQLDNFQQYQQRLKAVVGAAQAKQLVNQAVVLITLGGNDFVNNYYLIPNSMRSQQYSLENYVPFIVSEYKNILMRLYGLGARRVLVTGTGPMGCVPAELAQHSRNGECAPELQKASSLFNPLLTQMISQVNAKIGRNVFVAVNTNLMHTDFITNPKAFGFESSTEACCGQGPYNGIGLCTPLSNLCPNRDTHVFWDPFHPSEKTNKLIVQQIISGSPEYMHPMNLTTMLALDSNLD